jgi:hypothetical protein
MSGSSARISKLNPAFFPWFEKKIGLYIGQKIPVDPSNTKFKDDIPVWAEEQVEKAGFVVNRGPGPDLLQYGIDIKTRREPATSPHAVGRMTLESILVTPWDTSPVGEKIRYQYRIIWNTDLCTIMEARLYDFTGPRCQHLLQSAYEHAQMQLWDATFRPNPDKKGEKSTSVKYRDHLNNVQSHIAYFELDEEDSNSWQFRPSPTGMKILTSVALSEMDPNPII